MCKDMSSYASMIQRPPSTDDMEDVQSVKSAMVKMVIITLSQYAAPRAGDEVALFVSTHNFV